MNMRFTPNNESYNTLFHRLKLSNSFGATRDICKQLNKLKKLANK